MKAKDTRNMSIVGFIIALLVLSAIFFAIWSLWKFLGGDLTFERQAEYAILSLPNGEIVEGEVDDWSSPTSQLLRIEIQGKTYVINSKNAVIIEKEVTESKVD